MPRPFAPDRPVPDRWPPADRRTVRALRPTRAPAGVAVSLALSMTLGVTAAEWASRLLGAPLGWIPLERLGAQAAIRAWSDPLVLSVCAALVGIGVLLLLAAAIPGRTRLVPLRTADPLLVVGLTRSGLCRSLRAVAEGVAGVDRARVTLDGRRIEIVAVADADRTGSVLREVSAAVGDRLACLGVPGGEIVVRLRRKGA